MNRKQVQCRLVFLGVVIITILTFLLIPPSVDESQPKQPQTMVSSEDVADQSNPSQKEDDPGERKDRSSHVSKDAAANVDDIMRASTDKFPFRHTIVNGREWIWAAEIEEYLVLKAAQPPIQNEDVKGVQQILKKVKMYNGDVNGIYDRNTVTAVKSFQQYYGLLPTGVVDLDDYHLLADVYEETIPSNAKTKPTGNVSLLIILDERTLYVMEDGKPFHQFPIAVGTVETPSPIGNWKIISKDSWGEGFGTRWMGFNTPYGKYGIHGTNKPWSIGGAESHGCLRMFNRDIEVLYNWVTWGTRVYVVGGQFPYNMPWRTVRDGDRGSDVWMIQNRLKELGYLSGEPDGLFGPMTKQLMIRFQKDYRLPITGEVDVETRNKMGLYNFQ